MYKNYHSSIIDINTLLVGLVRITFSSVGRAVANDTYRRKAPIYIEND